VHPCPPKFTSTLRIEVAFGRQGTYVSIAATVAKGAYFVCKVELQLQQLKVRKRKRRTSILRGTRRLFGVLPDGLVVVVFKDVVVAIFTIDTVLAVGQVK
jgi:hypothetical protein